MKISVLVPVYKEPKYLEDVIRKILNNDFTEKELVVVVDGDMTPQIKEVVDRFNGKIRIQYPGLHTGKALALNNAVKEISTDILLFLDNDIRLPDNRKFLSILHDEMERNDIVEMPKDVIAVSIFSGMISYEYLSFAMACLTFSGIAKRSPGVIGAAFAVRKEMFDRLEGFKLVVHEDGDFGARAFRLQARYSYSTKLTVRTSMPDNLSEWITQRKRWTLINVLWFKDNFLYLLLNALKRPSLLSTLFVIISPVLVSLAVFLLFHFLHMTFIMSVVFMVMQPFHFLSGILLWFTHYLMFSQGLISMISGFLISTLIYFTFARFMKFRFKFHEYIFFYFIYVPLLIIVNVFMFLFMIWKKEIKIDWKV